VRRQKIYVFHGYNDAVVAKSVTDAAADFYRHYLGEANRGNLYYQTTIGAGHSLVIAQDPHKDGLKRPAITPSRISTSAVMIRLESFSSISMAR